MGFETEETESEHPGEISNQTLLNLKEKIIYDKKAEIKGYLDTNLKDQLKEGSDYLIMGEEAWKYLHRIYGGRVIRRKEAEAEKDEDSFVEVNLVKIYVFDIPKDNN